jgi:hypothetical protein
MLESSPSNVSSRRRAVTMRAVTMRGGPAAATGDPASACRDCRRCAANLPTRPGWMVDLSGVAAGFERIRKTLYPEGPRVLSYLQIKQIRRDNRGKGTGRERG